MNSIGYKSIKHTHSTEIQAIHWPGLLDIILTVVLVFILILTVFFISKLEILPWLEMLENQETVATTFIAHYDSNPELYNYQKQQAFKNMEVSQEGTIQTIKLSGSLLFGLGNTELKPQGLKLVTEIGEILSQYDSLFSYIEIVGHTDRLPVRPNLRFKDNLDLSCLRATSVVRYLIEQNIFSARKLAAVGRSYFEKIDDPRLVHPEQRRVEIRISYNVKDNLEILWQL